MKLTRRAPVDYPALADFRYEMRRFLRVSEEAARAAGLEPRQHQALLAIKGAPSGSLTSIAWLAERLQVRHHSLVGLVDRLSDRGLVERHRDPGDHRRVVITLTEAGEAILHDLSVFHQDEIRARAPGLLKAMTAIMHDTAARA
jgi:DNA-binding MarR family transcriptional regulator